MEKRSYQIELPVNVELEYDRQSDSLYIYLDEDRSADEEVLSEDGNVVFGFREKRLVFIYVMKFSEIIGGYIL